MMLADDIFAWALVVVLNSRLMLELLKGLAGLTASLSRCVERQERCATAAGIKSHRQCVMTIGTRAQSSALDSQYLQVDDLTVDLFLID
ncbi:hypothetical protein HU200_004171 [Digitaria exilis]|uniref:Uncharacterized protein n=1 Tax=Digitaria exilis TaxID=1010633 RepID=A0A835FU07_9POAL|nr:hypothetical protein HU200_004171 [Digitaria exilis]